MKTAISIPDHIYKEAQKVAKKLGISKSGLLTKAIEKYLIKFNYDEVTRKLDNLYDNQTSGLDDASSMLQFNSISDDWK